MGAGNAIVIENLITLFSFKADTAGARAVKQTYTDLRNAARDLVRVANFAGRALLEPLKHVVAVGEHAVLAGKRLGVTAEEIQGLEIAARLSNVPLNSLTLGMERLGRAAYEAGKKGSLRGAFADLGIDPSKNGKLKGNVQLFYETAAALSRIPDAGRRSALAFQLMGRGAGALIPLLAMGPGYLDAIRDAAQESGNVLSNETAQAARDLGFWWKLLDLRGEALQKRIGVGLIPVASKIVGTFTQIAIANKKITDQRLDVVTTHIAGGVELLAKGLIAIGRGLGSLIDGLGGFENALTIVEAVLGLTLLAAVGAATAAIVRLGVSLLFTSAMPLLVGAAFGILIGILFLVNQDLHSTNSLLKELWDGPYSKDSDPPILGGLRKIVQLVKDTKEGLEFIYNSPGNAARIITGGDARAPTKLTDTSRWTPESRAKFNEFQAEESTRLKAAEDKNRADQIENLRGRDFLGQLRLAFGGDAGPLPAGAFTPRQFNFGDIHLDLAGRSRLDPRGVGIENLTPDEAAAAGRALTEFLNAAKVRPQ